jgi:hypothetical protein
MQHFQYKNMLFKLTHFLADIEVVVNFHGEEISSREMIERGYQDSRKEKGMCGCRCVTWRVSHLFHLRKAVTVINQDCDIECIIPDLKFGMQTSSLLMAP